MSNPYSYELYQSIDDVNAEEWRDICRRSGNVYLDPRFLKGVEVAFAADAQFWYAIYRDEAGTAVAATCFSRYLIDCALMAPPVVQRLAATVRTFWRRFLKYKVLLCGIPVSTCDSQLAIADEADPARVVAGLSDAAMQIARQARCRLISFKEFSPELAARINGLTDHGFLKARSVYAYHLEGNFESFNNYLASRPKRTRAKIRKSLRSFEDAGLTCEQLRGRDAAHLLTPEFHQFYLNVLDRAKVRFERLPEEFFPQMARQLPDESCFTIARQGDKIIGFCFGIAGADQHVMLFVGRDYDVTPEADLYFNLIYRGLDQGLTSGVRAVHIGASSDEFKQQIGCRGSWLSVYVKAVKPLSQILLKQVFGLLFDTRDGTNAPPPAGLVKVEARETTLNPNTQNPQQTMPSAVASS